MNESFDDDNSNFGDRLVFGHVEEGSVTPLKSTMENGFSNDILQF